MNQEENTNVRFKITGVLKKFRGKEDGTEWTNEEINAGLADDYLIDTMILEDEVS